MKFWSDDATAKILYLKNYLVGFRFQSVSDLFAGENPLLSAPWNLKMG